MKTTSGLLLVLAALSLGTACRTAPSRQDELLRVSSSTITKSSPYWKYVQRIAGRDPVEEACSAFDRGRLAIYSATGYALYYPGLDYGLGRVLAAQFGATALPGFSHRSIDREQLAYMRLAEQYAAAYNREMRRLLTESGKIKK